MRDKVIKTVIVLSAITVFFVVFARLIGRSETVADYAKTHGQSIKSDEYIGPTVEVVDETPNASVKVTDTVKGAASDEMAIITDEVKPTEAIRPTESTQEGIQNADESAEAFYIEEIPEELKEYMRGKSYASNIDETIVNFDMLRHVVILYNDFDGNSVKGELVCSELIAQDLLEIFEELYNSGYQFEEVALIDKYDADDDASMEANNTSCFNYRLVDRSTKLSYHAYGLAIDINPFYNPYVEYKTEGEDYICPTQSVYYAYRDNEFPYKIDKDDLCYKLFKEHGFTWGGNWNSCKDYQHFEKRLR